MVHSTPSNSGGRKSSSGRRLEIIAALPRIRWRDIFWISWPIISLSSEPVCLATFWSLHRQAWPGNLAVGVSPPSLGPEKHLKLPRRWDFLVDHAWRFCHCFSHKQMRDPPSCHCADHKWGSYPRWSTHWCRAGSGINLIVINVRTRQYKNVIWVCTNNRNMRG